MTAARIPKPQQYCICCGEPKKPNSASAFCSPSCRVRWNAAYWKDEQKTVSEWSRRGAGDSHD